MGLRTKSGVTRHDSVLEISNLGARTGIPFAITLLSWSTSSGLLRCWFQLLSEVVE
jgi:S-ribosylhomocysteine lyase LuxS involved in autoinducer biosynthesis